MAQISLEAIDAARRRIDGRVHLTPVLGSSILGARIGAELYLKCENLQKTGSFKPRGALNLLEQRGEEERRRGVVTISAGNHAQAVAWAARAAGVEATVVMPEGASPAKVAASRGYGAEVVLHGDVFAAFERAHELERERGLTFVHPFDDERIVQGTGTVGLELVEQLADVAVIVVPIGGGGLISGVALAAKQIAPTIKVYGVEPVGAAAMRKSLDAGHAARLDRVDTVADGLAPPMAGELNYTIVRDWVDDVVTVSDPEILEALGAVLTYAKLVVEPSGAAAVAALLAGKIPLVGRERVVAILSGGNVGVDQLSELLKRET